MVTETLDQEAGRCCDAGECPGATTTVGCWAIGPRFRIPAGTHGCVGQCRSLGTFLCNPLKHHMIDPLMIICSEKRINCDHLLRIQADRVRQQRVRHLSHLVVSTSLTPAQRRVALVALDSTPFGSLAKSSRDALQKQPMKHNMNH